MSLTRTMDRNTRLPPARRRRRIRGRRRLTWAWPITEFETRKDGERGEQGNQVWEVSRRHFASPWLSNRYCTLETIQKGSASRARERCLCLRPMLHGNHAGAPLLPPFYSFPLCTMRCSVILLPLTFMLLSDRTIDRRCTFSVFEKFP